MKRLQQFIMEIIWRVQNLIAMIECILTERFYDDEGK